MIILLIDLACPSRFMGSHIKVISLASSGTSGSYHTRRRVSMASRTSFDFFFGVGPMAQHRGPSWPRNRPVMFMWKPLKRRTATKEQNWQPLSRAWMSVGIFICQLYLIRVSSATSPCNWFSFSKYKKSTLRGNARPQSLIPSWKHDGQYTSRVWKAVRTDSSTPWGRKSLMLPAPSLVVVCFLAS